VLDVDARARRAGAIRTVIALALGHGLTLRRGGGGVNGVAREGVQPPAAASLG
jgi:hypothetical protein